MSWILDSLAMPETKSAMKMYKCFFPEKNALKMGRTGGMAL